MLVEDTKYEMGYNQALTDILHRLKAMEGKR